MRDSATARPDTKPESDPWIILDQEYAAVPGQPTLSEITAALDAMRTSYLRLMKAHAALGDLGEALQLASIATDFRTLAARLECDVAEIEELAAELHERPDPDASELLRGAWQEQAQGARGRAARARERADAASTDNINTEALLHRYTELGLTREPAGIPF